MSWDDMDQAPGDLATVLADEFAVWFQNLGAQGILPRAFTGVTKDGKQGIVILTGLPFGHVQRRDFLIWLCRTEQFVAYAYGTHVGKIDSPSTFTFTEEVNIYASSHRYDVTKMLGIDKLADGTFRIFERDHSVMPASSKNGIFLGLQRSTREISSADQEQFRKALERYKGDSDVAPKKRMTNETCRGVLTTLAGTMRANEMSCVTTKRNAPMLKLPGHGRYAYSPIVNRPDYTWPGGKRLAFYVALNIEHFAFGTGLGMDPVRSNQQTTRNFAWRDYGNRIGNWRLFEILDDLKLPATILLNSSVCYHYPEIVEKIKARGDDVLGHGRTNAELLRGMWEHDEARAIQECTEVIEKYVGVRPTGWMGPGALESNVTPDLLKEARYTHLLDWPVDDQPIWMQTRAGPLLSVPYPMELNDAGAQAHRDHTGRQFGEMIVDQFEEMLEQSERQPLVFALSLHGFIVGQPFRLRPVRQAIRHCVEHKDKDRVWYTRAGDIANYCVSLPKGIIPGS